MGHWPAVGTAATGDGHSHRVATGRLRYSAGTQNPRVVLERTVRELRVGSCLPLEAAAVNLLPAYARSKL